MPEQSDRVVINLATAGEDPERVTVAFLVANAALGKGRPVAMFLTKEAVRIAIPAYADAIEKAGAPPLVELAATYRDGGGELLVCPICFSSRQLAEGDLASNARLAGATPLWEWIGEGAATVFSY